MNRRSICIIVTLAAVATTLQSAPLGVYVITGVTITDLGTLGGAESEARDINDRGTIVGWSLTEQGIKHAFAHYPRAGMSDIGGWFGSRESQANGVNNSDAIVGSWWTPGASGEAHAAYWNGGAVTMADEIDASVAAACQYGSAAYAIDDSGRITGTIGLAKDLAPGDSSECLLSSNAALWANPWTPSLLSESVPPSSGLDINNTGMVVGRDKTSGHDAVRWTAGANESIPTPPTSPPDFYYGAGTAFGVNNSGRIVGSFDQLVRSGPSTWTSRAHAFVWNGSSASSTDLGVLPTGTTSVAREVNEQGFVAGFANKLTVSPLPGAAGYLRNVGFLWHSQLGMHALPRLPTSGPAGTCEAYALNNRKSAQGGLIQIVGFCTSGGSRRAVRWDVTTTVSTPPCDTPSCRGGAR